MNIDKNTTILIVPGLRDHVPEHWQTLLEEQLVKAGQKVRSVPPLETDKLSCAARVAAMQQVVSEIDGPIVIVAHSAGCMITVQWAQQHSRAIQGALLAAPADLESPMPAGYPSTDAIAANGWLPIPRKALPFTSIVAASSNDPLGQYQRVVEMAQAWGSRAADIGAVGHLNPAAGFGPWPQVHDFINELCGA
ncbi:alpha/beta hydrolase [Crenobacter sp. SG2305]|uniref:RBBP9/YdeN family alpha/beta hydrolase n=1 Tax=Crenobacter oryzisoli TaxID=3056844 RepID=UPI0025AACB07|nr:alpha/beta fold hydrolase [Crenobacter sp. SG2305]MDN0083793.1 alpha/beta hydrolase [Crenobacter sp. SG2305]